MRAGNLKNKITLQTIGNSTNAFGEIEEGNFQDYKTVWASIIPVSGKESFLSNANFSTVSHKIKIRYIPNLNASMRIIWKGRIFNINYLRNISESNDEIEILATEFINGN